MGQVPNGALRSRPCPCDAPPTWVTPRTWRRPPPRSACQRDRACARPRLRPGAGDAGPSRKEIRAPPGRTPSSPASWGLGSRPRTRPDQPGRRRGRPCSRRVKDLLLALQVADGLREGAGHRARRDRVHSLHPHYDLGLYDPQLVREPKAAILHVAAFERVRSSGSPLASSACLGAQRHGDADPGQVGQEDRGSR